MDEVDHIVEGWRRVAPELDAGALPIVGRLLRITALINRRNDAALHRRGLSRGEFDLLCALRRADRPLRAAEICTITGVSGAAITKWGDVLVAAGLVDRAVPERDRRGVLLALTDAGRTTVDALMPDHLAREAAIFAGLSKTEREALTGLLAKVLATADRD